MLRPYLLHLGDSKRIRECYGQLLDIIRPTSSDDCSQLVDIPSWCPGEVGAELREQFRISLATNFYGWDELLSLRMRLSLADFAWVTGSLQSNLHC
jgi:general transcription factor 3C protein 4